MRLCCAVLLLRKSLLFWQGFPPATQFRTGSGSDRVNVVITRSLPLPVLYSAVNCNSALGSRIIGHFRRPRRRGRPRGHNFLQAARGEIVTVPVVS
jgi:hypothetical protein